MIAAGAREKAERFSTFCSRSESEIRRDGIMFLI